VERGQFSELFLITHVGNVASIVRRGILSHNSAARLPHHDLSLGPVQDIRAGIRVSPALMLHDYANLYFCARNPMMFYIKMHNSLRDVCQLRIEADVLDLPGVVVADGNASRRYVTRFDPVEDGLPQLDFQAVHAYSWKHPEDDGEEYEHKRVKCAEVLVPHQVPPELLLGAYCPNATSLAAVEAAMPGRDVRIEKYPFFL
jgi:hypothetical protein